jgi:sRNA-binding protein
MIYAREHLEAVIQKLAETYPKCFFETPQQRRPLKKNIILDLQKDGFPVASELLSTSIEFYMKHFAYQYSLETGAKRIDLHGNEVGTVTALEHDNAQKKIRTDKQKVAEKQLLNASKTTAALHSAGRITDDQLRKLDAAPMAKVLKPDTPAAPELAPQLTKLYAALAAANTALSSSSDAELRKVMANAALGVLVREAQRMIDGTDE